MLASARTRPGQGWLALTLAALVSFAVVPAARGEAPSPEELEALRVAIEESRERVGSHERAERDLLQILEELEQSAENLSAQAKAAQGRAKAARSDLLRLEPMVVRAREKLAATRASMARRAVALYKTGEVGPVRVLFSSDSAQDLLVRASALQRLLDYDADLVARYRAEFADLEAAQAAAVEAGRRRDAAVADVVKRRRDLAADRTVRQELLARARTDRTRERGLLVELERAARALEETLELLEDAAGGDGFAGGDFAALKGGLARPVDAEIAQGFGRVVDADYQTETFRKGVEFAARAGDSVRAVAPGQVRYSGWFRGYGKIVIVDHGDGYFSVSGHLADVFVEVGHPVARGDTLGTVGETGSLSGPSLYFELRARGGPEDPQDWFGGSARG